MFFSANCFCRKSSDSWMLLLHFSSESSSSRMSWGSWITRSTSSVGSVLLWRERSRSVTMWGARCLRTLIGSLIMLVQSSMRTVEVGWTLLFRKSKFSLMTSSQARMSLIRVPFLEEFCSDWVSLNGSA
uniref:(northern house mosquito) hypothetical protein n=1 Tax=Culex pipiens TaxID=7175 RepID=A0A8D8I569_CULPI